MQPEYDYDGSGNMYDTMRNDPYNSRFSQESYKRSSSQDN